MELHLFKKIFNHLSNAVAYCSMVFDENNQPIDFIVIDFNREYATLVALNIEQDKGIKFSDIKRLRKETLDFWIGLGYQATSTMKRVDDLYYSNILEKHFQYQIEPIDERYFIIQIHDVTIQMLKLAEKEIIIQSLDNVVFEFNESFAFINVYTSDESKLFLSKEHFIGHNLSEFFPTDLSELFIQSFIEAKQTSKIIDIEYESPFPFDERWFKAQIQYLQLNKEGRFIANVMDITTDKEISNQLNQQKSMLEKFFMINLDLLCIIDLDGRFVRLNKIWEKTLGYKNVDLVNNPLVDYIHPEDIESTLSAIEVLKDGGDAISFVSRFHTKDGTYRIIEFRASLGDNELIYGAARDITLQKELEIELREQKEQFEMAIEGSQDGIWDWDIKHETLFLSKRFKLMLGYNDDQLENKFESFSNLLFKDDYEYVMRELSRFMDGITSNYDIEFRMIHKHGHHVWIRSRAQAVRDEHGHAIRLVGSHSDITISKLANQELQNAYSRLNQMAEHGRIMTWELNEKGVFTYISPISKRIIGYDADEIINTYSIFDLHPKQDQEAYKKRMLKLFSTINKMTNIETQLMTKDGEEVWVLVSGMPTVDSKGKLMGYRGSYQDITSRIQQQKELQESEEKYRLLTENISDVVWIYDLKMEKFSYFSPSIKNLSGYSVEEMLARNIADTMSSASFIKLSAMIDSTIESFKENKYLSHHQRCEIELKTKFSYYTWVELVFRYRYNDAHDIEVLGVGRDINARKKYELELQYLSYHDQLTGVYNRGYYEIEFQRLNSRRNLPLSIIMGDINDLKLINDTFGHLEGDQHIKDFANILKQACREDDIIARTGGDEFVVLLPKTSSEDVHRIVERIQQFLKEKPPSKLKLSASIGFVTSDTMDDNLEEMFKEAEDKMYKQKIRTREQQLKDAITIIEQSFKEKFPVDYELSRNIVRAVQDMAIVKKLTRQKQKDCYYASIFSRIGLLSVDSNERKQTKIPEYGYQILKQIPGFRDVADIVLSIQECVDGSGYPQQLVDEDIPLPSKMIRIASDYWYHKKLRGLSKEDIINRMTDDVGRIYDQECFKIFISLNHLE
jgi:diguanylate cyclase (GGDEF)-like protein/PAS domain S-box-containing protein